jgi:hypothetical protein
MANEFHLSCSSAGLPSQHPLGKNPPEDKLFPPNLLKSLLKASYELLAIILRIHC